MSLFVIFLLSRLIAYRLHLPPRRLLNFPDLAKAESKSSSDSRRNPTGGRSAT
jgi:hypothetical protein